MDQVIAVIVQAGISIFGALFILYIAGLPTKEDVQKEEQKKLDKGVRFR